MSVVTSPEAANAATWRAVVTLLYEACGSPDVPGYAENQVRVILAGHRPIESRFTGPLITACRGRMRAAPVPSWCLPVEMGGVRIAAGHDATVALVPRSVVAARGFDARAGFDAVSSFDTGTDADSGPGGGGESGGGICGDPVAGDGSDEEGGLVDQGLIGSGSAAGRPGRGGRLVGGSSLRGGSVGSSSVGSARGGSVGSSSVGGADGGSAVDCSARSRRRAAHAGAPPDPTPATTATQFMEAMRQLRTWSGMSLRAIEEASRRLNEGRDWIPRSSLADVLKRDTLPRPELLETFTAALSLPNSDRICWTVARRRLADAAAGSQRARGQGHDQGREPGRAQGYEHELRQDQGQEQHREDGHEHGLDHGLGQEPRPEQREGQAPGTEAPAVAASAPPGRGRWRPRFRRLGQPDGEPR